MNPEVQAHPIYRYTVRSGTSRDVPVYERVISLEGDACNGFRLSARIDEEESEIGLAEILLEDALSSELPGDESASEHVVDGFGHALGLSLARHLTELTPAQSASQRADLALQCIVTSLNAPYTEENSKGVRQFRFEHCPIREAADRTGIEDISLAHHALNSLVKDTIKALDPFLSVSMPTQQSDEHVFSLSLS